MINVSKFAEFAENFPVQKFNALQSKYPNLIDYKILICELKYIYSDSDFMKCKSANVLLELFHELGLLTAFPESTKLLKLLLTLPVTSVSNERSFSVLDRIKSFLRSTMTQERLPSLARISIEKEIITELEKKQELNEKVLEEFALKPRRLEFIYK